MIRHAAVLSAAVLLLAGCTAAPAPIETVTGSPTAMATDASLPAPEIGTVGPGTLAGHPFEIAWDGIDFGITGLNGLDQADGSYLYVLPHMPAVGYCPDNEFVLSLSYASPTPLPISGAQSSNDPTYLHSVSQIDVGPRADGCFSRVTSVGEIIWTIDPLYPELIVVDAGETGGAKGIVTLEGAVAVAYKVNQGDVLEEIAARFGLTPEELKWLNPRRTKDLTIVYKDETLNLSPSGR